MNWKLLAIKLVPIALMIVTSSAIPHRLVWSANRSCIKAHTLRSLLLPFLW